RLVLCARHAEDSETAEQVWSKPQHVFTVPPVHEVIFHNRRRLHQEYVKGCLSLFSKCVDRSVVRRADTTSSKSCPYTYHPAEVGSIKDRYTWFRVKD